MQKMKRPKPQPDLAPVPQIAKPPRPFPTFQGFTANRTCANCEHFEVKDGRNGICHNGISQKYKTRAIDGCGYGFYPATDRFPLKAGPGGVWG